MKFPPYKIKIPKISILLLGCICLYSFQTQAQLITSQKHDQVWQGSIENIVPVFLYYQKVDSLIVGKVIQLKSKANQPFSVISNFRSSDGSFILNEYDKTGNITGVWTLTQKGDSLVGIWDKPFSVQKYDVHLTKKDTLILAEPIVADPSKITGDYFYQYGEKGPQGEWKVKRVGRDSLAINAWSVTHAPARNIAEIEDTVALTGTHFIYKINMEESWMDKPCKIIMKGQFYKNFLRVTYINENPCAFYFGHNATLEGIFYKIKNH